MSGTLDLRATGESYFGNYRYGWWDPDHSAVRVAPGGRITRSVDGVVRSDVPFEVDGELAPDAGEIRLSAGLTGTSTGTFGAAGLATIAGGSGAGTIGDGATIAGRLKVADGRTQLAGTVTGTGAGQLEVAGGVLTGAGDVDLAGELVLTGGEFSGSGTAKAVTLTLHDFPFIFDRTVEVTGTGAWTGESSVPTIKGNGRLVVSGTLDLRATGESYFGSYRYGWWDADRSSIRVAPGGAITRTVPNSVRSDVPFDVDGELSPSADATVSLRAGGSDDWTGRLAGAGTVVLDGGTFRWGAGMRVAGHTVMRSSVSLEGRTDVEPGGVLRQEGWTLDGAGGLYVAGRLDLAAGTHGGTGLTRIEPDGELDLGNVTIDRRTIHNRGTATFAGSGPAVVILGRDARFENVGRLTLSNTSDSPGWSQQPQGVLRPLVRNQGRIDVALPPAHRMWFTVPFENDGELRLRGGTLDTASGGFQQTPDGVLDTELRQAEQGDQAGAIAINPWTARLAGTLRLSVPSGETVTPGQSWRVVQAWSMPGTFSRVEGADAVDGIAFTTQADSRGLLVSADAAAVAAQADLTVELLSAQPGARGTQTHRFAVRNAGDGAAPDARLADALPDDLELVSASTGSGPCSTEPGGADCRLGTLAPDGEAVVEVVTRTRDADPGQQDVRVTSAAHDANLNDNALRAAPVAAAAADAPADARAPDTAAPAAAAPRNERPVVRARVLRVRPGALLVLDRRHGLLRGARDLRLQVVRRSPGAARATVRSDGRLRLRAPRRRTTLWLDVVAVDPEGDRAHPSRVRIVVR
ncbi:MAG TPA: hypothetical protein VGJ32_06025 [Solirubrobacteraceae bacterium]